VTKLQQQRTSFVLLLMGSLLIGWRPLAETLVLSLRNDEFTHILLILPISVALIILEWRFRRPRFCFGFGVGAILLAIAAMIACCAQIRAASMPVDAELSLRLVALVLWWIGSFVLCFGSHAAQSVLFSLLFLFGLVPLPRLALEAIISILQLGSAWVAHLLFIASGVPVIQDGVFLTVPGLTIQVAQECSSIRSSSMLLVATTVFAHVLLRSFWRKALLIGLAIPLSVAKNGLRIFMIAMLAIRVDPGYLTGKLHHQGGILFFTFALLCIFVLLAIFRKGEVSQLPLKLDLVDAGALRERSFDQLQAGARRNL
jgi:exosortase